MGGPYEQGQRCRHRRQALGAEDTARTAEYQAYKDEAADPPALVVQVGKTQLRYHLRAIDDLYKMLKKDGDWVLLGSADEQSRPPMAPSKLGGAPRTIR